jgi:hypothetical protein
MPSVPCARIDPPFIDDNAASASPGRVLVWLRPPDPGTSVMALRVSARAMFFWSIVDYRGPGAWLSSRAFFRTSHLAPRPWLAFGLAGSAAPSLCTLGRLAGRPWCPPSLLRQSSALGSEGRSRGPCIYLAYGRSTCAELASRVDTKVSHDDTVEWKESRCVVAPKAWAAKRPSEPNAEDCLCSEGGHRRLCAATSAPAAA